MTATAHQLRRRRAAADTIVARLTTVALRGRFVAAASLALGEPSAAALRAVLVGRTDYPALLALAADIAPPNRRRRAYRNTESRK